jgi:hypothetical protein
MDFNSLSVTLYLLITLFGTVAFASVSLIVCVRVLMRLTPSALSDVDDDTSAIRLRRSHRPE